MAADVGSFTDAALELHVSQAAVSRTIASLERTVGDRVLRRCREGASSPPPGPSCSRRPAGCWPRRTASRASSVGRAPCASGTPGRVGAAHGLAAAHLRARHPGIELLSSADHGSAGLLDGGCDVAVLRRAVRRPAAGLGRHRPRAPRRRLRVRRPRRAGGARRWLSSATARCSSTAGGGRRRRTCGRSGTNAAVRGDHGRRQLARHDRHRQLPSAPPPRRRRTTTSARGDLPAAQGRPPHPRAAGVVAR